MKCTARKTNGEPCVAWAIKGKTKCRVHGGKSLSGVASGRFKTGRYSKSLPARLAARYEASASDPRLLELRDEVSLTDARIADLLGKIDTGESGQLWKELATAFADLTAAIRQQDSKGVSVGIAALSRLIAKGNDDSAVWDEVLAVVESRRRLVESESKRVQQAKSNLSIEQAMLMIGALTGIIREHVTDRNTLNSISVDIEKLISVE